MAAHRAGEVTVGEQEPTMFETYAQRMRRKRAGVGAGLVPAPRPAVCPQPGQGQAQPLRRVAAAVYDLFNVPEELRD